MLGKHRPGSAQGHCFLAWPRAPQLQNCRPSQGRAHPGHAGCCTAPRPLPCRCQDGRLKQPPDSAHHPTLRTRTSVPGGSSVLPLHTGSRPVLGVARPRQGRQTSTKATQEMRSGVLAGGNGNPRRADTAGKVRGGPRAHRAQPERQGGGCNCHSGSGGSVRSGAYVRAPPDLGELKFPHLQLQLRTRLIPVAQGGSGLGAHPAPPLASLGRLRVQ